MPISPPSSYTISQIMRASIDKALQLDISTKILTGVQHRLSVLYARVNDLPQTLVHGDFDPGNIVLTSGGRVTALDWGLSHRNIPWVDLAHMIGRFDPRTQARMTARYIAALDWATGSDDLVKLGDQVHQVFFLYWHSQVILQGWDRAEVYRDAIQRRIYSLVE